MHIVDYHRERTELIPFILMGLDSEKTLNHITSKYLETYSYAVTDLDLATFRTNNIIDNESKKYHKLEEESKAFLKTNGIDLDRILNNDAQIEIEVRDDFFERIRLAWKILTARKSKKAAQ